MGHAGQGDLLVIVMSQVVFSRACSGADVDSLEMRGRSDTEANTAQECYWQLD